MNDNKPKYSLIETKIKLEAYCAYQERCIYEIEQKLWQWKIPLQDHNILISDLISNNFLNEERFAEAYASGKFKIKKWGKLKIKAHLKMKHISEFSIKKALNQIDINEYQKTLQHLAIKKWEQVSGNQWEKLSKLKRYLSNKGYESSLLEDIFKTYIEQK